MKCEKCGHESKEIEDYEKIVCKKLKKEFRIYKWEDKKFSDFPMPIGFDWAEVFDFVYLYDNDLIKLEKFPVDYFTNKISKKNKPVLSRLYLSRNLVLVSNWDNLADSGSNGRVVVSKELV